MKLFSKKDRLLYLAILAFVFVSTTALAIGGAIPEIVQYLPVVAKQEKSFPPLPALKQNSTFPVLSAQGVLAVDLDSGISLYDKNSDGTLLPASTTKIVTALVTLDNYSLDEILTVPKFSVEGQKMGLIEGEQMRVENLLYALLVYSANDAGEVLARNFPGGYDAFIAAMNAKAAQLSMKNSHFDNPVGFDQNAQRTTARDLAVSGFTVQGQIGANQVFVRLVDPGKRRL